jgi:serine/threonine protein kinase/tetratricopeptide (TPR) repeat protein
MGQDSPGPHSGELDDFIRAYEAAQAGAGDAHLASFLPAPDHPLYCAVLRELVRVDLEYGWERGRPKRLTDYCSLFADLFRDSKSLEEIAFEEYRLRQQAGENPSPLEYEQRFGINTANWPVVCPVSDHQLEYASHPAPGTPGSYTPELAGRIGEPRHDLLLAKAARAYQRMCGPEAATAHAELPWDPLLANSEHARVFEDLHRADPRAAERLAQAVTAMPEVGSDFLGFRLRAELGRGAFCRAYLAQQGHLANRLVVIKVGADLVGESQMLAQLQHTHIVPIYSFHREGPFQAVCMPYVGAATLAEIIAELQTRERLPASGKDLVTILEARRVARQAHFDQAGTHTGPPAPEPVERATLKTIEKMSYVEAILWIGVRLADALAHAHERGILHRDLKPANILISDDGQPMLSDFNLSFDMKLYTSASAARIGGTLGYMAPEHLDAFQGGARPVDARSDLYAFGIILFELLTGRRPFALPRGPLQQVLAQMRADRLQARPELRRYHRAVSPAVEAIIRHCLEAEPHRRYQTAQQLREDLQRQLDHWPLKYTSEPSVHERCQKWQRRHPRLASSTTVAVIACFLLVGLLGLFLVRSHRLMRLEAITSLHQLHADVKQVQYLVNAPESERLQLEEGLTLGSQVLKRYHVLDTPSWQEMATVRSLSTEQRQQLFEEMGELLLLLAGATARQAKMSSDSTVRQERLEAAMRLNARAEECYPAHTAPRALWQQRTEFARLAGHPEQAQQLLDMAKGVPLRNARERYLLLASQVRPAGQRDAMEFLREACRKEPDNFAWWLALGDCQAAMGQPAQAVASYDRGLALWPGAHWGYFNRGVVCLEQLKDYRQASEDFDQVLRLRPDVLEARYNRALAKYHLGDCTGALTDLNVLLEERTPSLRAYFLRAKVRDKAGDRAGAERDRNEGLRREPSNEKDWIARGVVRLGREPEGALADFGQALQLDPRSRMALQNQAHVLAEKLGRTAEAIQALDTLVELYPDYVHARASRGVYHARLGQRDLALRDAKESLLRDSRPPTLYQVAGIYALTAREAPEDRWEAFRLLSSALRKGYGFDLLVQDRDLDPIREYPEFRRLVEAARALRPGGRRSG